ncbi:CHAT domain-containing protein, partial [Phormidium sp. CCY1219]|uniref:CHAT domain-containing protein n=1 Tax=Phormidium sp. CCY1219 TaxID=2886104 RepID=UPI002D1E7789
SEKPAPEAIAPEPVVSEKPAPEAIALPPLPSPEPAPGIAAIPIPSDDAAPGIAAIPIPSDDAAPATPAIPIPSDDAAPATPAIPIPSDDPPPPAPPIPSPETAPPVPAPPVRDTVPEAQGEEVSPATSAPARETLGTVAAQEVPSTPEEIPVARIPSPLIPDAGIPPMPAPGRVPAEEMVMSEGESPPRESPESLGAENPVDITSLRRQIERLLDDRNLPQALRFIDLMFTEEYARYLNLVYARELQSFTQIQDKLRAIANLTGTQPAIIYTFMRDEQLDLVLVPPQGVPIYKTVPEAKRDLILEKMSQFRQDITNPLKRNRTDYLVLAQQFHDWIIAPLETDIQLQNIDILMFSMDGGMRTLPVAALHDRAEFLVEKYRVGLIPSVNLTDTRYESLDNARVLAMGASKFTDKIALPAVPVELSAILTIWPGKSFLNEAFTFSNLKLQREKEPFRLVHLATHSEFNPGNPEESYIQLWDGRLSLDRVRELNWNSPPVELLVLSACRTAVGDENAELGFAGLAVNAGVKSALASLWYVNDEGTLGLMSEFYHQLRAVSVKAEALRRSQVAMIRGEIRVQQGELIYAGDRIPLPPPLASVSYQELSHPYYWAGFTAIGSPW